MLLHFPPLPFLTLKFERFNDYWKARFHAQFPFCPLISREDSQQFIDDLPHYRFDTTIGNRVAFSYAMAEGKTVTETAPSSKAGKEIKALVAEISHILAQSDEPAHELVA